jgi:hypothetical protein
LPLTLRALLLVPLFAAGVDQARAVVLCGSDAQGCLEAAGRGWIGLWGVALIVLYSLALAWGVARAAACADAGRAVSPRAGFARLWALGTSGVAAVCAGQAALAAALGGAPLGGGWLGLLALCMLAGALLALTLRVAPALRRPVRAPRSPHALHPLWLAPAPLSAAAGRTPARRPRGRAPPLTV